METPSCYTSERHQHGGRKLTATYVTEFCISVTLFLINKRTAQIAKLEIQMCSMTERRTFFRSGNL